MMKLSEEQLAAFQRNGYVTVKGLFSTGEVVAMRGALKDVLKLDRPELVRERNNNSAAPNISPIAIFCPCKLTATIAYYNRRQHEN
jgi:hypothetical protein